jgi:hypothetical protein
MKGGVKRPKPGEKRKRQRKQRPLSPFSDPRVPTGHKNLTAFLLSCDQTTTIPEAIREYQNEWCDHPKDEQLLITTFSSTVEDRHEYSIGCLECGRVKTYKGRPSTELTKRGLFK